MKLDNPYAHIGALSHSAQVRQFSQPQLLLWNSALAKTLGLSEDDTTKAQLASGQSYPDANALAYAGHQFGNYVPLLGDGRAHLLGAVTDPQGLSWDVQLKGSGATQFSRGGDGLCGIGPAVREFIMSEALAALKVPTTRCLSVALSGETVMRQQPSAGAIVTRVASSHIRVGSFQFLAAQQDEQGLAQLVELTIKRHYPELAALNGDERLLALFSAVMDKQIELIVHWLRIGFIHGVMNTDNTLVSGETIDYGPCAMLNGFDFGRVFSSIDRTGRYAFGNQPQIASWNLARFAETLIDLFSVERDQAVAELTQVLNTFGDKFNAALKAMWLQKLGLLAEDNEAEALVDELLGLMQQQQLDYTNTFAALTAYCHQGTEVPEPLASSLGDWLARWQARIAGHKEQSAALMSAANPQVIPRNHRVEEVIADFERQGHSDKLAPLLAAIRNPYCLDPEHVYLQQPPEQGEDDSYQTFCGT
ncbi:protein adenylyltransferase SelO [Pseudoalteromonas sp. T1lg75]|uniref:protein adenylyltransferase SelO n=1 Tax=Pseudoalteromonas sp. T1lg75 TaxID=2077102 RepID=UPI000CF69619|nr:YdiU family protein [Pseudoalteromonas sp. T1lg75]